MRPILYPVGTRTAGVYADFDPEDGVLPVLNSTLEEAWNKWREEHGEWLELEPLREDMFITVAFTACGIHVEVSDRLLDRID
jgi:hypothetical protein